MVLLFFLCGILFVHCILPLLESLTQFIGCWFEYQSTKIAVKAQSLAEASGVPTKKNPIGFAEPAIGFEVSSQEDFEEDDV